MVKDGVKMGYTRLFRVNRGVCMLINFDFQKNATEDESAVETAVRSTRMQL